MCATLLSEVPSCLAESSSSTLSYLYLRLTLQSHHGIIRCLPYFSWMLPRKHKGSWHGEGLSHICSSSHTGDTPMPVLTSQRFARGQCTSSSTWLTGSLQPERGLVAGPHLLLGDTYIINVISSLTLIYAMFYAYTLIRLLSLGGSLIRRFQPRLKVH